MRSLNGTIFALLILITSCGGGGRQVRNFKNETVPSGMKLAQVEKAIRRAAKNKKWTLKKVSGKNVFIARQIVRSHEVVVKIPYSIKEYSIIYKNSSNMKYDSEDNTIHHKYNYWTNNLKHVIDQNLSSSSDE